MGKCQLGLLGDNSALGFLGGLISSNKNKEPITQDNRDNIQIADIWGGGSNTGNTGNLGGRWGTYKSKPKPKPNEQPLNYFNTFDISESLDDRFGGIGDNDAFLSNPFNNNDQNSNNYNTNGKYDNRPNKGNANTGTGSKVNPSNNGNRPWTGGSSNNNRGTNQYNQGGEGNNNNNNNFNNGNNGNNWGGNTGGGNRPSNKGNGNNDSGSNRGNSGNNGNRGNSGNNDNRGNSGNSGNKGNNSNKNKDKFTVSTASPERNDRTTPTPVTTSPTKSKTTTPSTDPEECLETVTMVGGKPACSGELIFKDNFSHLNRDKWDPEIRFAGAPDYEFVLYVNDTKNLHVAEKKLCIKPTLLDEKYGEGYTMDTRFFDLGEGCTAQKGSTDCVQSPQAFIILPPVESARVNTRNHFTFLYGTVEIRAKLPKGDWIYPELYLTPSTNAYGPDYDSGSIRIAFLPGNADISKTLSGGCILGASKAARAYGIKSITSNRAWSDTYHKFTIKWKPESITVYVDDEVYGKVVPPEGGFATEAESLGLQNVAELKKGTTLAPFDKEMYLTIGVGVGGHCFEDREGKPYKNRDPKAQRRFYDARETWKKTWNLDSVLQIDYINVIAL